MRTSSLDTSILKFSFPRTFLAGLTRSWIANPPGIYPVGFCRAARLNGSRESCAAQKDIHGESIVLQNVRERFANLPPRFGLNFCARQRGGLRCERKEHRVSRAAEVEKNLEVPQGRFITTLRVHNCLEAGDGCTGRERKSNEQDARTERI